MIRQEIIRDKNYNIIEEYDNCGAHIKYDFNGNIIYYKTHNLEYPSFKSINSPQEQKFVDFIKDGIINTDEIGYSNHMLLFKNGRYVFKYDLSYGTIWFTYELARSIFNEKTLTDYDQIREFLKNMMEKHFNCIDIRLYSIFLTKCI